ncbi:putative disease resistance RPP13 protein 1 [Spatholobus suberectus]|nr:putative disease resistance RPP13 protein 1 [Spatholobus suberectus]
MVDVAGALLSAFLQVLFDRIANPKLLKFFSGNNLDKALEELKTRLLSVNALLGDAEEKQVNDTFVKSWVDKLREAVYDAEDVLDQIATKALQCNVESRASIAQVTDSHLNVFSESMKSKLEGINGRLSLIVEHKQLLGLKEGGDGKTSLSMPTTSLINEREVYGRDGDRDFIVDLFLSLNHEKEVSVIAIVGMAGTGKTTLSQIVYKDPMVESHFKVRLWVYISDGSNVFEVTKKIYESLTGFNSNIRDLNTLQVKLESELREKRFLLVLDDYWAEGFLDWDLLKKPLESGARGSSIIVTTRNKSVALAMHAAETYLLPLLSEEACRQLFAHHAFRTRYPEATLMEIGEEIVRKCKGHPLAVKTLGSLLAFKTEAKDWNNILQSKMWDLPADKSNILPALRLSYRHLPGHLKRCFAYCSIFPKGYTCTKRNLIHLWMAEGLLRPSKNEETMEEVGEEYLHELSLRSILQSNDSSFTLHDLMIDLAQHNGGEFFLKMEHNDPQQVPEKVRHLSFLLHEQGGVEKFEAFFVLPQLRTFLPLRLSNSGRSCSISEGSLSMLLRKLKCLRVLSLSNYPITVLPDSIGGLMHLRYLNLSHTSLQYLPDFVGSLYNLQTLLLSNCRNLEALPRNLQKVTNLLHLDISGTSLLGMPPQFGELKHLQVLTTFVASREGSKISELGELLKLHGALSIVNLQKFVVPEDAYKAKLKEKKFLDDLELKWKDGIIHDRRREKHVLHNLRPHTNLKILKIEHYGAEVFPDWLGSSSFSNMVSVHLVSCETCLSLPALGQLPYLKTLHIENMTSLKVVDAAFFGNHTRPFSSLESLTFVDMSKWEQWQLDEGRGFPSLKEFCIQGCPKLDGSLPRVPALLELELTGCSALRSLPEEMMQGNACLRTLVICNCPCLESFPKEHIHLTLESLQISGCRNLDSFWDEHATWHYRALKQLHIESSCCDILTSFPLSLFTALHDLHVLDCHNLESLSLLPQSHLDLQNLSQMVIKGCPNLVLLPEQGFPNSLASLIICDCPRLAPLCRRDEGPYWHLLSGLPKLVIDEEIIIPHDNAEQ